MKAVATKAESQSELRFTRVYDAPRKLLFEVWTDPKHIMRWWGPRDFSVPHAEFDARPGGKLRIDFRGPDGVVFPNHGVVREVVPWERLSFTTEYRHGGEELLVELLHTAEFREEGAGTRLDLTVEVLFAAPEAADSLAHMEQGTDEQLDKLAALVAAIKGEAS